jgi:putative transposase
MRNPISSFAGFPIRHWRQIWSTNPLERVNKEIKRRTDVFGVSRTLPPCWVWLGRSRSSNTTNGKPANAAIFRETSTLQPRTINPPIEPAEEAVMLPELTAASTKPTDPHGVQRNSATPRDLTRRTWGS